MTTANRALVLMALVTATGCQSKGSPAPLVVGPPARHYAVTYRVEDGDRVSMERLVVDRPFASHLVLEGSERITAVGRLATRSQDGAVKGGGGGDGADRGAWTLLEIPPAPAGRDLRPDIALAEGQRRHLIQRRGVKTVAGRRCQVYRVAGPVTTGTLEDAEPSGSRYTEFCLGRGSIVLEQVEVEDSDVSRRVRATEVKTGTAAGAVAAIPDVEPLAVNNGGGRTRPMDANERPPFDRFYVLPAPPEGFTAAGRYAVVPLGLAGATSLVADVYTRDADVVIVDQGASTTGQPPFDEGRPSESVHLGPLVGDGEVVLDLRANEVRVLLPDGGFLRVVGTLPPDDLVDLARTLVQQPKEDR